MAASAARRDGASWCIEARSVKRPRRGTFSSSFGIYPHSSSMMKNAPCITLREMRLRQRRMKLNDGNQLNLAVDDT
jgi:hypothetical protein